MAEMLKDFQQYLYREEDYIKFKRGDGVLVSEEETQILFHFFYKRIFYMWFSDRNGAGNSHFFREKDDLESEVLQIFLNPKNQLREYSFEKIIKKAKNQLKKYNILCLGEERIPFIIFREAFHTNWNCGSYDDVGIKFFLAEFFDGGGEIEYRVANMEEKQYIDILFLESVKYKMRTMKRIYLNNTVSIERVAGKRRIYRNFL